MDVVHSATPTHPPEMNQNHTVTFPLELVHRGSMTQKSLGTTLAMISTANNDGPTWRARTLARPDLAGKMAMHAMDGNVKLQTLGAPRQ